MKLKRGRPKEPKNVKKINPVNVHLETTPEIIPTPIMSYKCDTPRCNSRAEVFINLKYCPLCAKDKGF